MAKSSRQQAVEDICWHRCPGGGAGTGDVEAAPSVIPTLFDGTVGREPTLQSISKFVLRSDCGGLLIVINQVL